MARRASVGRVFELIVEEQVGDDPGGGRGQVLAGLPPPLVAAVCSVGQAGAGALLVVAIGHSRPVPIYVLVAVAQLLGSMGRPCSGAIIASLVGGDDLGRLNSWYAAVAESSMFAAPAAGALLLHWVSPAVLVGVDSATFLVAAVGLLTLPVVSRTISAHPGGALEGLRCAWAHSTLRPVIVATFCSATTVTAASALLAAAAAQRFHSAGAVGVLYGAVGVGGVAGSALAGWRPPKVLTKTTVVAACGAELGTLVAFALVPSIVVGAGLLAVSSTAAMFYAV